MILKKQYFPDTAGQLYVRTHKDRDSMDKTPTSPSQTKPQQTRGQMGTKIPPLAKKLLTNDIIWEGEKSLCFNGVSISTALQVQEKLDSYYFSIFFFYFFKMAKEHAVDLIGSGEDLEGV